jgi:hypothetical protein
MASPAAQRCSYHADRHAFARCMSCAKMLCQECATQWDGIWHCAACLGAKRKGTVERSGVVTWFAAAAISFIFLYAGARLMAWFGAAIAGMF